MRILVVEDDAALIAALERGLRDAGFSVDLAGSAEEAIDRLAIDPFDAMILDLGLPGADGLTLLGLLRERGLSLPVLVLTARGELEDRVAGLDAGADDYLRKPFAFPELLARLRALLRRGTTLTPTILRVADLELDPAKFEARRGDTVLPLTTKEFVILEYFMRHAGQLVTRSMLLEACWDAGYDGLSNLVDVHVGRLRRKLDAGAGGPLLHTIRAAGFPPRRPIDVIRPRSLRTRLTLTFALMAVLAIGGSVTALAILVEHAVWGPLDAGLQEEVDTLVKLVDLPHALLVDTVREFGEETDLGPGKFVRVAAADGTTIAHARRVPQIVARHRPKRLRALTIRTIGRGERAYRAAWAPTPHGGWVVMGVRATEADRLVQEARFAIGGVGGALILLLVAAAWTITSRAITELDRLASELETIQAGSLARRMSHRDTTEVDRLVDVLNRMLGRLESAVGHLRRFTADAAHELRTPIAAVRAHLDVTLARAGTVDDFRNGVLDAIVQADRLGRLADDLLTLSMIEGRGPDVLARSEDVRLDDLVREVAEFLEPVAEEQARPFTWKAPGPVLVRGVPTLLKRVVLNLVDNAFRHAHGAVRVELTADAVARIEVSDGGPGIPPDVLPRMFERFRHGASDGSGSGLGLALVREIVLAHHGTVDVRSAPQGTTFTVVLPIVDAAPG